MAPSASSTALITMAYIVAVPAAIVAGEQTVAFLGWLGAVAGIATSTLSGLWLSRLVDYRSQRGAIIPGVLLLYVIAVAVSATIAFGAPRLLIIIAASTVAVGPLGWWAASRSSSALRSAPTGITRNDRLIARIVSLSSISRGGSGLLLLIPIIWAGSVAGLTASLAVWACGTATFILLPGVVTRWFLHAKLEPSTDPRIADAVQRLRDTTGLEIRTCVTTHGLVEDPKAMVCYVLSEWPSEHILIVNASVLEELTPDELFAIVCHEAAHMKHRDLLQARFAGPLLAVFLTMPLGLFFLYVGPALAQLRPWLPSVLFGMLLALTHGVVFKALIRHQERRADAFAVRWAGKKAVLDALARTLQNERPMPRGLLATHDSYNQRVASVERL